MKISVYRQAYEQYWLDLNAGMSVSAARQKLTKAIARGNKNRPKQRYKGDWLPKDSTAKKKGRARRRIRKPKSEFEIQSNLQLKADLEKQAKRKGTS